jgi:Fe-S-cluster containining protein
VPELFHHQRTFIGCLSVRWLGEPAQLLLGTRAYDTELSEHCPALDGERHCSIHDDHKPAVCRVVPFDEQLPDHLQHLVLAERAAEARYVGSDCIAPGTRAGFPVVTRRLELVDEGARAALAERRRDLANEQRFWGKSLTPLLAAELGSHSARAGSFPEHAGAFLTLSIAPVLMELAAASTRCRERCMAYLVAQGTLCERTLKEARRAGFAEHAAIRRLAAFTGTNARLLAVLTAAPPLATPLPSAECVRLERWLGLN